MSGLSVKKRALPYLPRLEQRNTLDVDLLVIHCTELPDLGTAREYAERIHYTTTVTGNSGHFYIDRDGSTEQWVPIERIAHHVVGYNHRSIGVELVNRGRYPDWLNSDSQQMTEHYPVPQLDSLIGLIGLLCSRLPQLTWLAGHEQLDREQVPASDKPDQLVYRKRDPGPLFPWKKILRAPGLSGLLQRFPE